MLVTLVTQRSQLQLGFGMEQEICVFELYCRVAVTFVTGLP
jgi:hypothetical protein